MLKYLQTAASSIRTYLSRPEQYTRCEEEIMPFELGARLWHLHQMRDMTVPEILEDMKLTAKTHGKEYRHVRHAYMARTLQERIRYENAA